MQRWRRCMGGGRGERGWNGRNNNNNEGKKAPPEWGTLKTRGDEGNWRWWRIRRLMKRRNRLGLPKNGSGGGAGKDPRHSLFLQTHTYTHIHCDCFNTRQLVPPFFNFWAKFVTFNLEAPHETNPQITPDYWFLHLTANVHMTVFLWWRTWKGFFKKEQWLCCVFASPYTHTLTHTSALHLNLDQRQEVRSLHLCILIKLFFLFFVLLRPVFRACGEASRCVLKQCSFLCDASVKNLNLFHISSAVFLYRYHIIFGSLRVTFVRNDCSTLNDVFYFISRKSSDCVLTVLNWNRSLKTPQILFCCCCCFVQLPTRVFFFMYPMSI